MSSPLGSGHGFTLRGRNEPELATLEESRALEDRRMVEVIRQVHQDILPTGFIAIQSGVPSAFRPTDEQWARMQEYRSLLRVYQDDPKRLDEVCLRAGIGVSNLPLAEWFLAGYPWANDSVTALKVFGEYGKLALSTWTAMQRRATRSDRALMEQLSERSSGEDS